MSAGKPPIPAKCDHKTCGHCWKEYSSAQFPNWTPSQLQKSRIAEVISHNPGNTCICHRVDIDDQWHFKDAEAVIAKPGSEDETWKSVQETAVSTNLQPVAEHSKPLVFIASSIIENKGNIR
jgi:hypothetical protein